MRTLCVLIIVASFVLSCQKEASSPDATNNVPTDTSALAKFVKAAGITDQQVQRNLDSLITRARNHGWWDLCKVIYPLAGGTANSCKFNLKDPQDANESFRLSFMGDTWTYTSVAINPGDSGYAYTYFNPYNHIANQNSVHMSVFSVSDAPGEDDNADIGAMDLSGGYSGFYLSARTNWPDSSGKPFGYIGDSAFQGRGVNGGGYFLMTKNTSEISFFRDSSVMTSLAATPAALPNLDLFLCNQNFSGAAEPYNKGFSQRGLAFVTIGSGISGELERLMYRDISDFVESK